MSQFAKFIKFTEMLTDAEKELGIDHLSGLDKRILYFLEKASVSGSSMSFEELNKVMDTPRATLYRHVQTLVDRGLISKQKDPNDGRRNIISVTIPVRIT